MSTGLFKSLGVVWLTLQVGFAADVPTNAAPVPEPKPSLLPVVSYAKDGDTALVIKTAGGTLRLEPYLDGVLHIQFGPDDATAKPTTSYVVVHPPGKVAWDVKETADAVSLVTKAYQVVIDRASGGMTIEDAARKILAQEPPTGGRVSAAAGASFLVKQVFAVQTDEGLYGLGEHRGELDWAGKRCELVQMNTQAAVPVILSTRGYSILWDNPSRTMFKSVPSLGTSFTSDFGSVVDYYFMTGASFDELVAHYRDLTGAAPMFPKWALGYHQSRNRYSSQKEIVNVLQKLRDEKIPDDSIFLDYMWWDIGVGSHQFRKDTFPDPKGMVDAVHALHSHLIVSVWPSFDIKTDNYQTLHDEGYLLDNVIALHGVVYDVFNPKARDAYDKLVADALVPLGIDGWFLDGPEPDEPKGFLTAKTFAGSGAELRNLYPLMHSGGFYQMLRTARPDQRVYIITRCGFTGQQRNATTVWSGDIKPTFEELKEQIPSGLSFTLAGIPYWTTDVGGYNGGDPTDPAYQEIYTRWWEYGVFCPIFRSHGKRVNNKLINGTGKNELWAYGPQVQKTCTDYDNLRYRLLPYIYALAGKVMQDGYTMMRALVFDFPSDTQARELKDEFMFGPAFLVCPVTDAGATSRSVYLPAGANWIDFWTGQPQQGGQTITADAPLEKIPLFVRAGSIVPMGPFLQYADETPADPVELRIYPGADGDFSLYEDDGKTYAYEKGAFSTIAFHWDDKAQTLRIAARQGSFPAMLASRTFHIVWVDEHHGTGLAPDTEPKTVTYDGTAVDVKK